ncbi:MAG TPA: PAS domain S-box protein, partial [Nitrospiria bacterium]|nr:PAS domain S-box protein [Nitrospiria bacterium]
MIVNLFLVVSFLLQCVASYLALRIAHRSQWRTTWLFIAVAVVVMTLRHAVMMVDIYTEAARDPLDVISEWLALIVALLLVVGLAGVGSLFAVEQRAERAPRETDRHYNALFEQSAVGIAQIDSRTGRYVRVNQCYCDMVGYTHEEMLRKDFQSITHPDDLQADLDNMAHLRAGELDTFQMEKRYVRKDGDVIWVRLTVLPLWTRPAEPDLHLAVVEDITDRKRAEERLRTSEMHLKEAQRVAHIGNWNWDIPTNIITWSDEMYRIFGLEPQQGPIEYETFLSRIHPGDRDEVNGVTQTALKTHQPFDHDRRVVWPDGTVRVYHSRGAVEVDAEGTPVRMYGTAQDITDRRQAEEALRESEERYRNVVELSPEAIFINQNGRIVFANTACVKLLGATTVEQLIGKSPFEIVHPDHHHEVRTLIQGLLERGDQMPLTERRWIRLDGTTVHVEVTASVLPFADGTAIQVFARDISARRHVEERLNFMQFSVARASDAVFWLTSDARIVDVNESACRILGYTKEELLAMTVFDIDPEFTREDWSTAWNELKQQGSLTLETRHRDRSGRMFPVEINANYLEFGGREYNCAFARDITDRKRAEETAREVNRFNQQIIANAREGIIVYDRHGRYAVWNPYMEELTGLKADRVLGKRPTDLPALYEAEHARLAMEPGTMKSIEAAVAQAMAGNIVPSLEVPILFRQSGETGWTSVRYGPFRNAQGDIVGVIATVWEMTERKRAEEALQVSEERFRASFKNARIGMALVDHRSGRFVETNRAFSLITGYAEEELKELTFNDITHPDDRSGNRILYQELIEGKREEMTVEKRYVKKDGSLVWVNLSVGVIRDGQGHVKHTIGLIVDISQRKQAEAALREHAERMQLLSRQLVEAQEVEGRRIGRELHDDLGQILTSLKIYLQTLPERTDP